MAVTFNHLIIPSRDPSTSAQFYRFILGAREAPGWGPFVNLLLDDDTLLQFAVGPVNDPIHLAFLMSEDEFRRGYEVVQKLGIDHWADPRLQRPGEIATDEGLRVYFRDPSGHFLELLTEPYV